MRKQEFLARLRNGLSGLPQVDIEERLTFYGEMIDDRMEEGLSEEDAVSAVGTVDDIVAQAVTDIPLTRIAMKKNRPKRHRGMGETVLLALGSPIWLSLGIAVFAVVLSIYLSLWAVIIALWSVFGALVGCALGGIMGGIVLAVGGHGASGVAMIAAGAVCAGLSVFLFFGCKAATSGIGILTRKTAVGIKKVCIRKEKAS